jgi:hypothetical protein
MYVYYLKRNKSKGLDNQNSGHEVSKMSYSTELSESELTNVLQTTHAFTQEF